MLPAVYTVEYPTDHGRLSIMPKPRGGQWLQAELAGLRQQGVDILISLLSPQEVHEFGLEREDELACEAGLEFAWIPVFNYSTPDLTLVRAMVERLQGQIEAGSHVVVHCQMGIGRAALLAACILIRAGLSEDEAWGRVSLARGFTVPDNEGQRRWARDFRRDLETSKG